MVVVGGFLVTWASTTSQPPPTPPPQTRMPPQHEDRLQYAIEDTVAALFVFVHAASAKTQPGHALLSVSVHQPWPPHRSYRNACAVSQRRTLLRLPRHLEGLRRGQNRSRGHGSGRMCRIMLLSGLCGLRLDVRVHGQGGSEVCGPPWGHRS